MIPRQSEALRKENIVLDLMRRHARSWLIKAALGGIIVVFVFMFGWQGPGDQSKDYAAKVNDTVITRDYFRTVYNSRLESLKMRFGGQLPPGMLDKLNLEQTVIRSLVNQILLTQEAERLGLTVTDQDLVDDIRNNPMFQRNGNFDSAAYEMFLRRVELSPAFYEQLRKREILEDHVLGLLTDGVKTDPRKIRQFWDFQNEQLVLSMALVNREDLTPEGQPDPTELETFFKEHRTKYEVPASLDARYVIFSWEDARKALSVSDEEAKLYYTAHPREFTSPERVKVRHILLEIPEGADEEAVKEIEKKAGEIKARIENGEDFEAVAKEMSQDEATAEKGGDLGFFARGTMNPELEKVAFSLEPGIVSDPVRTSVGFHIIKTEEKEPEKLLDFELVKDKIKNKLVEEKARKKVSDDAYEFYEQVYRAEDLEEPAKEFGYEVRFQTDVTRAGGFKGIGAEPEIMDEAFQLKSGEISKMIKSGDKYFLLKVVKKTKARLPELDEVRAEVEEDFAEQQAQEKAFQKAQELLEAVKQNPDKADALAADAGITWKTLDPVSRSAGIVPELGGGPQVEEMLASVSMNNPLYERPVEVPQGFAVLKLTDVKKPPDERYEQELASLKKWVVEVRKTEFLKGWLKVLGEKAEIDINEKYL